MQDEIDALIRRTAPSPQAAMTQDMEGEVWRRVGRHHRRVAAMRLQAGVLVLAVLIGALGGGVYAHQDRTQPSELQVLTVAAGLDPFSLASQVG